MGTCEPLRPPLVLIGMVLIAVVAHSCGRDASSSNTRAATIPVDTPGYRCFAIYDEGHVLGGNCVREGS